MVSEKQVAAVSFLVGLKTGAIQPFIQTLLKSFADSQLPAAGFINAMSLYRLDVSRDFDDGLRFIGAAGAREGARDVGRAHPPFDGQPVGVQAAMKSAGALVAVIVDIIPPHDRAQFDYVQISVSRLQRVESPRE